MEHTEPRASAVRDVYELRGVVQGVGFRPALYRLAREADLGGAVQNRSGVVRLVLEGPPEAVAAFVAALPHRLPAQARVDTCRLVESTPLSEPSVLSEFRIEPSDSADTPEVLIPPDLALCAACRGEVRAPRGRRRGYAFTTCTDCGPRYTVVTAMPYDRARTTMQRFALCPDCRREYEDPLDRRFHAETIACPACGPRLTLLGPDGEPVPGQPLAAARSALRAGLIVAVRGIGGFLLAADALNPVAIRRLRERKRRPHKPFAVMARGLDVVRRACRVLPAEEALLRSPAAPIVVLDLLPDASLPAALLSPDTATLGVMLPTSPLHELLLAPPPGEAGPAFDWLVMTSGNRGGEPICLTIAEAQERLAGIADLFLTHDREISLRNDDSLAVVRLGSPQVWRRARGYAPAPIRVPRPLRRTVLALGADLKNAIALGYESQVVLSPHVGDLDTPEALDGLDRVLRCFPEFLCRTPQAVAVDLHPDMQSTRTGAALAAAAGLELVRVQHHHAHGAAALAEHGHAEGLALVFDGTGYGPDGAIWGAELLDLEPGAWRRLASFRGVPLPGGDAAVRQPTRQLLARWLDAALEPEAEALAALGVGREQLEAWTLQCRRGLNTATTHAAGRLFDSVAVFLGAAAGTITYEGQPAIRLEALARSCADANVPALPYDLMEDGGMLWVDWRPLWRALPELRAARREAARWALAFHEAVARAAADMVRYAASQVPRRRTLALSGGVMMNRIVTERLAALLAPSGLEVCLPRQVPPGDGGIALGQAVIAGG